MKPRIIAEQYMEDEDGKGLKDYKFFCFNGEPRMMFIATNRPVDTRFDFLIWISIIYLCARSPVGRWPYFQACEL